MKYRLSLIVLLGMLAAGCAQRIPAPVTEWTPPSPSLGSGASAIQVHRGDTLFSIARRYRQPVRLLIAANHLTPPYRLEPGQMLAVPSADTPMPATISYASAVSPPGQRRDARPPLVATSPPVKPRAVAGETPPSAGYRDQRFAATPARPPEAVHPATAALTPPRDETRSAHAGPRDFIWPVRGRVVEGFGSARNGTQNDGINIAARAGAPVYAAAAGEVVYAGNELRGYGNLVLIKHEGGYLTAYAHNSTLLVHKGERVARGQTIARVGATGSVHEPQLHFEIRMGRNPVDPARYLPADQQTAFAD
jgi:murein DD-endopeptidase MepM/ murein hydrolase activator NlpD